MSFRLTSNCQQEHNQSNRTIGTRVTYHAYCYGCNDEHTSILPTVPVPNDYWETLLIQLYWKSTNINNTTSQLTSAICIKTYSLQFYSRNLSACTSCTKAMLHLPTVENTQSLFSICNPTLCHYSFRISTSPFVMLGQFTFGYSLTLLLSIKKQLNQKY